jgi:hypothetical protein
MLWQFGADGYAPMPLGSGKRRSERVRSAASNGRGARRERPVMHESG